MRIKTLLRVSNGIVLAIMCILVLSLAWAYRETMTANEKESLVADLQGIAYQRTELRDEYLFRNEERAMAQWIAKTGQFKQLLAQADARFTEPAERAILEDVKREFSANTYRVSELVEYRKRSAIPLGPGRDIGERRLISQIIVNAYDLNSSIDRLHRSTKAAVDIAHRRSSVIIVVLFVIVIGLSLANSRFINRIIGRRIRELHRGTEIIGAGNLDYRIPIFGNDEFTDLASTTNEMAEKLNRSYTSVDNLQREVGERQLAEEELKKSEAHFRNVIDCAGDAIYIIDLASNRIMDCNQQASVALGYTRDEMLRLRTTNIEAELPPDEVATIHTALTSGAISTVRGRHRRKDGSFFPVEVRLSLLPSSTQHLAVAIVRDVTERTQAQEDQARLQSQLIQAQKMESVGRLAGGVAHDFNNKLGVIMGHLDLIMDEVEQSTPMHANLQAVRNAAEQSAELVNQLLTFARKQIISPRVIELNETVEGMLKMLRRLIGEDINLAWLPTSEKLMVKVDPSQIDQMLANLCVNARDAIGGVGKVTIETDTAAFDAEYCANNPGTVPGDYVLLAVSDNGCGMDSEVLSKLFEPFFTTKELGKGTGLGLAMIYGIIKQNNGFVNVYSEPGSGTTFKVYLPRHREEAEAPTPVASAAPAMRGTETILLVEDEPEMLGVITMLLKRQGYTVLAASTPGEAIRMAEAHQAEIALLITDVVMPEMNGKELASRIQSRCPKLKRLFMSGYTANAIAHHGVLDEGVQFIQKPFSIRDIAAKVREVLAR